MLCLLHHARGPLPFAVAGELVTDAHTVRARYFRKMFFIDLISVVPFAEIALLLSGMDGDVSPAAHNIEALQLLACLRMYRVVMFYRWAAPRSAAPASLPAAARRV